MKFHLLKRTDQKNKTNRKFNFRKKQILATSGDVIILAVEQTCLRFINCEVALVQLLM